MFKDNKKKYDLFRKEYDTMVFEGYNFVETTSEIKVTYHFNLSDKYFFHPDLIILKKTGLWDLANLNALDSMLFHIGMVEMISYWKVACPPHIIIKPFRLSQQQLDFWKKLYYNGLGEFFYINNIIPNSDDFVTFRCESGQALDILKINVDENKVIIPVGGGKDSIVSLELLKNHFDVIPFILNPREASLDTCYTAGFDRAGIFEIKRTIDPLLLELNNKGFLNGHTPFSALLAFVSMIVATFSGAKFIALSNESSANEPTVENGANHQYSKSLEFESDFREYVKNLITGEIEYFSFLRPLSEFYIAKIFSNFESYFGVFKSCNVGSKSNSWCGNCPKCLFTYIIL
ncbi:MAG: hypothetical protein K8S16_13360, partial [Bacteroidales bacterium]|nr:hypothetical protein [Bacteroidales bacterium]